MKHLSVAEFVEMVEELKGCTAISLDTETEPKLLKKSRGTGEPCNYENISKVGTLAGLLGVCYSNAVNNQLGREDKPLQFESQERKWGTLSANRMIVSHIPKGQTATRYYLQMVVQSATTPIYKWGNTVINKDELRDFLPLDNDPRTQADLDKKVILRDIAVENIVTARMLGEEYRIGDRVEAERTGTETRTPVRV